MNEFPQKRIKVVRGCGKIEPRRVVELLVKDAVELGHPICRLRDIGESCFQDANRADSHGDLYRIIWNWIRL